MKKIMIALAALALVAAFSMPAAAQEKSEVSFGGFVAFDTWWVDTEEPVEESEEEDLWGRFDDQDLLWSLESVTSRLNATFKREDFTGFVELRPLNGSYFRHWYGEWDFGPGSLLVGQTWYPSFMPISSSVGPSANVAPGGGGSSTYGGDTGNATARAPMIRLTFPFTMGAFTFAMIDPKAPAGNLDAEDPYDTDQTLPHLEAKLSMNAGPLGFNLLGGWKTYEYNFRDYSDFTERDLDIDAYIIAANAKYTGGPFSLALAGWMGENPMEYGWFGGGLSNMVYPTVKSYESNGAWNTYDVDAWGGYINATFKLNEMVSFAAGGGMTELEREDAAPEKYESEATHWFVNSTITVAEGFTLTPEIGQYDREDYEVTNADGDKSSQDLGDTMYYGMYWKMNF